MVDPSKDPPGLLQPPSEGPVLRPQTVKEEVGKGQDSLLEAGKDEEEDHSVSPATSPSMGQTNSVQTSAQLERLQEQLKASVARSEVGSIRSISIHEGNEGENDEYLSMVSRRERSRSTSSDAARLRSQSDVGAKRKARPASAIVPSSTTWTEQLSHLAFPARKSID